MASTGPDVPGDARDPRVPRLVKPAHGHGLVEQTTQLLAGAHDDPGAPGITRNTQSSPSGTPNRSEGTRITPAPPGALCARA